MVHDHVVDFIKADLPKEPMVFCKHDWTWTFTDSKGNKYNVQEPFFDKWTRVMPEWDSDNNVWYWSHIPR